MQPLQKPFYISHGAEYDAMKNIWLILLEIEES